MQRMLWPLAPVLAVVLGLTACSDGSAGSGAPTAQSRAITSLAGRVGSGANFESARIFGPDFPQCFAERLVQGAGLERLTTDGVLTRDGEASADFGNGTVSRRTAAAYAEAEYTCIDWDGVEAYLKDSGDLLPATGAQLETYVACLADIPGADWQSGREDQTLGLTESPAIATFEQATSACRSEAGL